MRAFVKGATSRYFQLFFGSFKIVVNYKEAFLNNTFLG